MLMLIAIFHDDGANHWARWCTGMSTCDADDVNNDMDNPSIGHNVYPGTDLTKRINHRPVVFKAEQGNKSKRSTFKYRRTHR